MIRCRVPSIARVAYLDTGNAVLSSTAKRGLRAIFPNDVAADRMLNCYFGFKIRGFQFGIKLLKIAG